MLSYDKNHKGQVLSVGSKKNVLITAHAGAEGTKANSLDSVYKLYESPAHIIEVDVRQCRDQRIVLAHDDIFEGEIISKQDYEILKEKGICSLEDILPLIKSSHKELNIDIKSLEVVPLVAEFVKKHDLQDKVILSGCHKEHIEYLVEHNVPIDRIFNVDLLIDDATEETHDQVCSDIIKYCRSHSIENINIPHYQLMEPYASKFTEAGLKLYVWTVDEEDILNKVLNFDITSITTNTIHMVNQHLHK